MRCWRSWASACSRNRSGHGGLSSAGPAVRRVRRRRRIHINEHMLGPGESRCVATAVGIVVGRAAEGDVRSLRGLRVLPDAGKADSACRGGGRFPESASRRRRAGIIGDPESHVALADESENVFGRSHHRAGVFLGGDPGAIDAGPKTMGAHGIDPGLNVVTLLGQHASALFLVKKDDGRSRESLSPGGGDGPSGIAAPQCPGVRNLLKLCVQTPVKEDKKAESAPFQCLALSLPVVKARPGRIVEPVACIGEGPAQGWESAIAGVVVAVESEVEGTVGGGVLAAHAAMPEEANHQDREPPGSRASHPHKHTGRRCLYGTSCYILTSGMYVAK